MNVLSVIVLRSTNLVKAMGVCLYLLMPQVVAVESGTSWFSVELEKKEKPIKQVETPAKVDINELAHTQVETSTQTKSHSSRSKPSPLNGEALAPDTEAEVKPSITNISDAATSAASTSAVTTSVSGNNVTPSREEVSHSSDAGSSIIVLDASGSMWGQVDGKAKIDIAKTLVNETMANWPREEKLGLVAYGHNSKGDCADIEVLIEPSIISSLNYATVVNGLNPKGKTPLGDAVKLAANELRYTEEKATVILISDGIETCGVDACDLGRTLENNGVDFTAHIIGFDISKGDTSGLRCLADTTGGTFIEASNGLELQKALSEAKDLSTEPRQIKVSDVTISAPKEVAAGKTFGLSWTGPGNLNDRLKLVSLDGSTLHHSRRVPKDEVDPPIDFVAPELPGSYQIVYVTQDGRELGRRGITVTDVMAQLLVPKTVEAGSKFLVKWQGPANDGDKIKLLDINGKLLAGKYSLAGEFEMTAPVKEGAVSIVYLARKGRELARETIQVVDVQVSVDAPVSVVGGAEFTVQWVGPKNINDRLRMLNQAGKKPDGTSGVNLANPRTEQPAKMRAPEEPGIYTIQYFVLYDGSVLAEDTFEVIPATAEVHVADVVTAGHKLELSWSGPQNPGDRIEIVDLTTNQRKNSYGIRPNGELSTRAMAPKNKGQYELRYITRGKKVLANKVFSVVDIEGGE